MRVIEWFQQCEDEDLKAKLLANCRYPEVECSSLRQAVDNGFCWDETPEGHTFWSRFYSNFKGGKIEVDFFNPITKSICKITFQQIGAYFVMLKDSYWGKLLEFNSLDNNKTKLLHNFEKYLNKIEKEGLVKNGIKIPIETLRKIKHDK